MVLEMQDFNFAQINHFCPNFASILSKSITFAQILSKFNPNLTEFAPKKILLGDAAAACIPCSYGNACKYIILPSSCCGKQ